MSFLDAYELALAERVAAGDLVPVPLFPIGEWKSAKYPKLSLTQALADELIANFDAGILGTEPVLDSSGKHDTSAPAAGWFKRLYLKPMRDGGDMLLGDCELTELGAQQLNDGLYKYDSVEIDSVVLNDTGERVPNVFKSATLTNTPVLRMLPPVLDVGDAVKLAEPMVVALSEVTEAEPEDDAEPDPVAELCDKVDELLSEMDNVLKGKLGIPVIRTMMKEVKAKASAHALDEDEDDGSPVEDTNASSDDVSHPAKVDEGQPVTLAEGDAAQEGADHMNPTIIKALKLAEDADDEAIAAAVVTLTEDRDAEKTRADEAEAKLAETEKAKRAGEVDVELTEIAKLGNLTPGERPEFEALSEEKPEVYAARVAERKALPEYTKIKLGEVGEGGIPAEEPEDANVALAELATKIAADRALDYGSAVSVALAERPDLASRLYAR